MHVNIFLVKHTYVFLHFVNFAISITYGYYKNIMNRCMSFKTVLYPLLFPHSEVSVGIESHRLATAICQL